MAAIDKEDMRGAEIFDGSSSVMTCFECITDDEFDQLKEDELILDNDVDGSEKMYFCDRCKKQL